MLHVPDFQFNLISVHKLCHDLHCDLIFTSDACYVQGRSLKRQSTLLGKLQGGLYSVEVQHLQKQQVVPVPSCNKTCFSALHDAKLWHLRLGHLPFNKLKLIHPSCNVQECLHSTLYVRFIQQPSKLDNHFLLVV